MDGFISYSHDDYGMFSDFRIHLKSVERALNVEFWADNRLAPGFYWNSTIEKSINEANVFVLLVSPAFIASDYIYENEIPAIKGRHQRAAALVLPVVLRRCNWQFI